MSEARTLLQRLSWVQSKVDYIQKEKKQGMRYSIVSHDAVTAKVRPHMVEAGVIYYPAEVHKFEQVGNRTEMLMSVRFCSIDNSEDWIDVITAGYGIDDQDKGPGKAISYCVKYALLKALGLESGDDPDYDQEVKHEDPGNPHNLAMVAFEAHIELAKSIEDLEAAAASYKVDLEKAKAHLPARAMMARQVYSAKLKQLKEKTNG